MVYPFYPQEKFIDCVCIKKPKGNTENYLKEKIEIGKIYKYEMVGVVYRIYSRETGDCLLIRDEYWFYQHFATKESLRDSKIDDILGL